MKLVELQKLDFLLKKVNKRRESKSFKIIFSLNNDFFVGDFIPDIQQTSVKLRDVTSTDIEDHTLFDLDDEKEWKKMFESSHGAYGSYFEMLIDRSNFKNFTDYFRLLENTLEEYSFKFAQDLPPIIYNVESVTQNLGLHFFRVDENINFDSISIISEDVLYNDDK
ncbi:hypothetical protein AV904_05785 [Staphylococcus haemolyticus]|uniref:hypothetical protein n=2 Tax=Staphylococcus haemolyticus TaxID=1283 RepID=UPI0007A043F8|nr:hypothetical protein [Staphylococcus haemolyticus]AMW23475.1 hypothetical protein AV904_05785 [Staphylococcus haemolyticus]